jgi:hypothetical protein
MRRYFGTTLQRLRGRCFRQPVDSLLVTNLSSLLEQLEQPSLAVAEDEFVFFLTGPESRPD